VEEIRTPSTAVTAAAPSAPAASSPKPEVDEDGLTESETERITALNEWLDQVTPPLEAEDLYKAFGVAPDIDSDNLLLKHRELVIKFHSDRFERFDIGDATERLVVVWGKLNKGIVTLTDPAERAEYDLYLDRKKRGLPTDPVVVMRAESIYLDGDALLNAGKFQDALAKFDEAISMNGADPEFHVARSWARVQIAATAPGANGVAPPKLRDRARDACNAALKDIPRLARAHYYLGLLAKMDGNAGGARAAFSRAIELNPHYVEAKREIRLLEMRGGTGEPTPAAATAEQEEKGGLFGRFRKP
jgi:tetratricopeptide (TPR) repeat protein